VKAEPGRRIIAGLGRGGGEIDAFGQKSRGGAGLEPAEDQAVGAQAGRQAVRGRIAQPAAAQLGEPDVDQARQKGAGGEQDRPGRERLARGHPYPRGPAACRQHGFHRVLTDEQVRLGEDGALDHPHVGLAVDLGPGRAHGRAFAGVEGAELDAGGVGPKSHHAAQGVDFPYHVPLGQAADGRIAGQMADAVHVLGDEQGGQAQP